MQPNTPHSESRSGYRPTYIWLGTDNAGADHVYRTSDETIHVIDGTRRSHREQLGGRRVEEWLDYVAHERGWLVQKMVSLVAAIEQSVQVSD
jgi:hypothetical protein